MVRDNRVSLGFNEDEYGELNNRAKEAHLKLGDYIRWFLFNAAKEFRNILPKQTLTVLPQQIPYMASQEVIERIQAGKEAYVDPYQQSKLEAQKIFTESGSLGELHNSIVMKSKGGKVLKRIPKKDLKEIVKQKEERKHIANKHIIEIKEKNIEAGILNND